MRAIIVIGWTQERKPVSVYCGLDGTAAQKAADAAHDAKDRATGGPVFRELRKVVNPMGILMIHTEHQPVPSESILADRRAVDESATKQLADRKKQETANKAAEAEAAKRTADAQAPIVDTKAAEAEAQRLQAEAEGRREIAKIAQAEAEAQRARRFGTPGQTEKPAEATTAEATKGKEDEK